MLSFINANEEKKWNEIVRSFKNYDIYHLLDYLRAFQIHGDGEPLLIFYEDNSFRAMNVVMKRDISLENRFKDVIPKDTYFDITTPYGYGGFIIEGSKTVNNFERFANVYSEACNKNNIISEFVRFHPVLKNSDDLKGLYDIQRLGKTITMNLESNEQIWNDITGKNRNVIRKAMKSGVQIYWGRDPKLFNKFIKMYNNTMDEDNATDYYYFQEDFYNSILTDLRFNSLMFYAVYKGRIIAMSIVMFVNSQMHYHLSASEKSFQYLAPTNFLLYEAACWGCSNGYKSFHLGGGLASKEDNLFKFKQAFNKESETYFSIGKQIFDTSKYNELVSICEKYNIETNSEFFPLYRS